MYCPRCGTVLVDGALMCGRCGFHFDEPFYPQGRKGQHSMMWWFVVIMMGLVAASILMSTFLYLMVTWSS
jgi:hypothetical protein